MNNSGNQISMIGKLILINVAVFFFQMIGPHDIIIYNFALIPKDAFGNLKIWQFFTYMFLHGGFWHIGLNMYSLWLFGRELADYWGERYFLKFYLISGIGAGIFYIFFAYFTNPLIPTIGASGAVYAILLAYGLTFPDRYLMLLFPPIPIKAKYLVLIFGAIAFFSSFDPSSNIAHAAHLGGMVIGYILLKIYPPNLYGYTSYKVNKFSKVIDNIKDKFYNMHQEYKNHKKQEMMKELNRILDKINEKGLQSLSQSEKDFLRQTKNKL